MKFSPRTAASIAISGLPNASKIYKGYSLYEAAHSTWDGFASTGQLPSNVAALLGSKPYPTPPIPSAPGVLTPSTTSQHVHLYNHCSSSPPILQTLLTPHSGCSVDTPLGPSSCTLTSTENYLNTIQPTASPSTPMSMQSQNAAALAIAHEEAF